MEGTRHGHLIATQMLDVAVRVPAVREFTVSQMVCFLWILCNYFNQDCITATYGEISFLVILCLHPKFVNLNAFEGLVADHPRQKFK